MNVVKWICKIVILVGLLPVRIVLRAAKLTGEFVLFSSAWFFHTLALIFFGTTVSCYFMGIESGQAIIKMLVGSFMIFLIPVTGEYIVGAVDWLERVFSKIVRKLD